MTAVSFDVCDRLFRRFWEGALDSALCRVLIGELSGNHRRAGASPTVPGDDSGWPMQGSTAPLGRMSSFDASPSSFSANHLSAATIAFSQGPVLAKAKARGTLRGRAGHQHPRGPQPVQVVDGQGCPGEPERARRTVRITALRGFIPASMHRNKSGVHPAMSYDYSGFSRIAGLRFRSRC